MLALRRHRRPTVRRGAILLVVLAMLALFAVVALSFVLYAESEATSMRNGRAARNGEAEPDAQEASNHFLGQLMFDTDNNTSAIYGHGLATSKYGWVDLGGQSYSPYAGSGLVDEDVSTWAGTPLNRRGCVNYTRDTAGNYIRPHLRIDGTTINKSTPYTYADRANFYLAMQDPTTGEIVQPSFHRPDLFGSLNPTTNLADPGYNPNWTNAEGRYRLVRPRPFDHPAVGGKPGFPAVPANSDGSYTGDVQNMKYISGVTQKNDSLWMYTGSPVKTWRNKRYVSMIAPLVLDLSGRVNMSVAGNNRNASINPANPSASNQGWGAWGVNPTKVGIDPNEFQGIVAQRYTGSSIYPPAFPPAHRYSGSTKGTINGGFVPPQYARIDSDGVSSSGAADPMGVPAAGTYNPFLAFTARFADTKANFDTELADHPQNFNPFQWPRGAQPSPATHVPGMDDLVRLATRYIDPKNRYAQTELGTTALVSFSGNAPAAMQNRALTTPFSVTQSWAEVTIPTLGGTAKLGPVDLNRPLGDYRTNAATPFAVANTTPATIQTANSARQRLAMDIFLRLAALCTSATNANGKLIDGTVVQYSLQAHCLTGLLPANVDYPTFRKLAQYAVNMVDTIDNDDISTAFVWNPQAPAPGADYSDIVTQVGAITNLGDRVVFGTELPRLVVNEAYCKLDNDRSESEDAGNPIMTIPPMATKPIKKLYWLELHNPLRQEVAGSNLSDLGAARLQTVAGPNANIYQVVIADYDPAKPLSAPNNVTGDPGAANLIIRLTINDFTPAAPGALNGGEEYLVRQATGAPLPATNGGNVGYFVLGPLDKFPPPAPPTTVIHSSSLPDPVMATPTVNTLIAEVGAADTIEANKAIRTTVILRRLANPYLPAQPNSTLANFNPFITVDILDNIPTRDRARYDKVNNRPGYTLAPGPSIGRKHPYAAAPAYVEPTVPTANVIDQTPAAGASQPGHTFFNANLNYDNTAFVHYDRELINSTELMHVSIHPPHALTQRFSSGTGPDGYNLHNRETSTIAALLADPDYPAVGMGASMQLFKAFDLLTTANRMPGIPVGGREPGRVNVNTVGLPGADARVLQAVLDPQQGNTFAAPFVSNAWQTTVQPLRTPYWGTAPYIRGTFDETGGPGADKPFKLGGGSPLLEDTLFRSPAADPNYPMLFNRAPTTSPVDPIAAAAAAKSLYLQAEPHRKAANNLTTVSDGFLVIWMVGFFEVNAVNNGVPQLGQELFKDVPGDLRAQYTAVVDRSMLTVAFGAPTTPGPKPWETKLVTDATISQLPLTAAPTITVEGLLNGANLQIYNDGVLVDVAPGARIRIGSGDSTAAANPGDGEWVTIALPNTGTFPTATPITNGTTAGQIILTLDTTTPITRFHGGSSRVSNALPGNPGPQPGFDPNAAGSKHLVPYFTKLDP